jgi:gas vesicle protein
MNSNNNPIYFVMGLGMGIAAALLLAPKTGAETREFLSAKAKEGADYASQSAADGVAYAQKQAGGLKKTAVDGVDRGMAVS